MNRQDSSVPAAVDAARAQITAAIEEIVARLARGGRLIYVGAGSSGRIAALDAAECESTFSTEPGQVTALLAGGRSASPLAQEAAEDDSEAGALVVCVVSVPDSELARLADHEIAVVVGPEFVAGSTRLKAGTAQKLVLNTISTVSMIRLGKTYGDLMVDVHATNEKLRERVRRIVRQATGASEVEADEALEAAQGSAKVAIVSLLAGIDADTARARLAEAGGSIRSAVARLGSASRPPSSAASSSP